MENMEHVKLRRPRSITGEFRYSHLEPVSDTNTARGKTFSTIESQCELNCDDGSLSMYGLCSGTEKKTPFLIIPKIWKVTRNKHDKQYFCLEYGTEENRSSIFLTITDKSDADNWEDMLCMITGQTPYRHRSQTVTRPKQQGSKRPKENTLSGPMLHGFSSVAKHEDSNEDKEPVEGHIGEVLGYENISPTPENTPSSHHSDHGDDGPDEACTSKVLEGASQKLLKQQQQQEQQQQQQQQQQQFHSDHESDDESVIQPLVSTTTNQPTSSEMSVPQPLYEGISGLATDQPVGEPRSQEEVYCTVKSCPERLQHKLFIGTRILLVNNEEPSNPASIHRLISEARNPVNFLVQLFPLGVRVRLRVPSFTDLGIELYGNEEQFSSMKSRNDQPTKENEEKFERTIMSNPLMDHPKLYYWNHFFTGKTSLHSEWKKKNKRRSVDSACSSFLVLVKSLLHMIIALAITLAGSPVLVEGTERVTLQAGEPAVIPFDFPRQLDNISEVFPYFTLHFESKQRPFCINGEDDIEGFKTPSQFPRFTTSVAEMALSICVKVNIDPVDMEDEDTYVLRAFYHSDKTSLRQEIIRKEILVRIPPGPAKCFITVSDNSSYPYEVHCEATTGSPETTLTCYQHRQRVEVKGDVTDNGHVTRAVFLLPDHTSFSCCSHDVTSEVNVTMCNDFEWPPSNIHISPPTVNDPNLTPLVANTVDQIGNTEQASKTLMESEVDSGTCEQYMSSSVSLTIGLMMYLFLF